MDDEEVTRAEARQLLAAALGDAVRTEPAEHHVIVDHRVSAVLDALERYLKACEADDD